MNSSFRDSRDPLRTTQKTRCLLPGIGGVGYRRLRAWHGFRHTNRKVGSLQASRRKIIATADGRIVPADAGPMRSVLRITELWITIHHVSETSPVRTAAKTQSEVLRQRRNSEDSKTENMMLQNNGVPGAPRLDFEAWRVLLRSNCGGEVDVTAPNAFAGWMGPISVCGLAAKSFNGNNGGEESHGQPLMCTERRMRVALGSGGLLRLLPQDGGLF